MRIATGKEPLGTSWGRNRHTMATLRALWTRHPRAGVGLKLGREAGVIDVEGDGPEAEVSRLRLFGGEDVRTLGWSSARGRHQLLAWEDRLARYGKTIIKLDDLPGLEIRIGALEVGGKQFQSVVPPTPNTDGSPRRWDDAEEIASIPESFFIFLDPILLPLEADEVSGSVPPTIPLRFSRPEGPSVERRARAYLWKLPEAIEHQRGHDRLYRAACVLVDGFALAYEQALPILQDWNQEKAIPPETEKQIRHKLTDALKNTERRGYLLVVEPPTCVHKAQTRRSPLASPGIDPPAPPDRPHVLETSDPVNRTDLGNARLLATHHGSDLRYCHPWSKWLVWVGDRWLVDETGLVYRHARDVVARLHAAADAEPDDAARKALASWAMTSESERHINAMVSLSRQEPGMPILPTAMDADPWRLNCHNGTLDLRTGDLHPHDRDDYLTKRTSVPYDPGAKCPLWDKFLRRVMNNDRGLIDYLRRIIGYALTGDVSEHAIFFLYGRGRNGKSSLVGTIQSVLGDYAITVNADLLTAQGQVAHPTGLADLQGRRFVATIEVEDGKRLAEALVKSLTGADRIRARRMRQDFYEFDPTHKLFLAANHKPTVRGTDEGIWRRIKLIPFSVQIPTEEVDPDLPAKLRDEAPGILAWAVRGCLEWQAGGLGEPTAVSLATADYRDEMDDLADFLRERCVVLADVRVRSGDLYRAYAAWCKDTGSFQLSMRRFGMIMTERGFPTDKANSANWRIGIGLKDEFV